MLPRHIAAVAAAAMVASPAAAATADTQVWTNASVSGHVAPGLLGSFEVTGRFTDDVARLGQVELRTMIGTPLTRKLTAWIGHVHVVTYARAGRDGMEEQAVEQLSWTIGKIGRATLSSRTRLEQRFQRGATGTGWRVREQLRLVVPLRAGGPNFVGWAEPFVSLNRTSAIRPGIDQVRSFAGLSLPLSKHADVEAGYLNQYLNRATGDRSNNTLSVSVAYRF